VKIESDKKVYLPSRKVYLHRLGCPKLDVDNDLLTAGLKKLGANLVESSDEAETVIVSTCAFTLDAKTEAVEAMLDAVAWKGENPENRTVYVSGCLPARNKDDLIKEVPEVDGWFGPGDFAELLTDFNTEDASTIIDEKTGIKPDHPGRMTLPLEDRLSQFREAGSLPYSYLKISEGCSRFCAYCAIPTIRGKYRSRRPGSILSEASRLLSQGVKEIIVTAEEVNSYGIDLKDGNTINTLLPRLGELVANQNGWLRVLYTHPPLFDEEFINTLANTPALVPYLDFPIEHADDAVLKMMGRHTTWEDMKRWIDLLREKIDGIALRTSIIVGHPGEGPGEFANLLKRLDDARFERLGVFRYSPEEGTRAEKLFDENPVDAEESALRSDSVMALALEHADDWYRSKIGKSTEVLVEEINEDGHSVGRSVWDAPEIDGEAIFLNENFDSGSIIKCKVVDAEPFSFIVKR